MQIMETSSNYSQSKDEQDYKKKVAAYLHKPQWKGYSINKTGGEYNMRHLMVFVSMEYN